jgi:tetratricopeptide (TPR) repeat protein
MSEPFRVPRVLHDKRWLLAGMLLAFSGCAGFESAGEFTRGRQTMMRGDNEGALAYFQNVARADPKFVARGGALAESIWTYVGRAQYLSGKLPEAREALEKGLALHQDDHMGRLYLGLVLARLPAAPAKTTGFSIQDISFALREGVATERVAALARERGIAFDLSKETENQLRKAGADTRLLDEIRKVRAEQSSKNEPQTGRAAKELTTALSGLRDDLNNFTANSPQGRFWDPGALIRTEIRNGLTLLAARQAEWSKIIASGEWVGQTLEEEIDRARRDEADSYRRDRSR